jgi:hypothetical protein
MVVLGLPRYVELMKSPTEGMNVNREPANTPGSDRGKVTLKKATARLE